MSTWDSADLLERCIRLSGRPSSDTATDSDDWYAMLTEAQGQWYNTIAAQTPWVLMGAPTLLVSTDDGATYPFINASASSIAPLAVEVYDTQAGRLLKNGAYWDTSADYVWEGTKIRFPHGVTKTFANGPYARFITPPTTISASVEPTLIPEHARALLVYRAVALWATRGGFRDPTIFYDTERRYWLGDMSIGDVGLLGALRMQNPFLGGAAYTSGTGGILSGVDTGAGYVVYRG